MTDKKIGMQIKKARMEAQLTQDELGKKIGVTWEMVSRYENGRSSARQNLEKIAKVLGKPIQYFFGVEEAPITDEIKKLTDLLTKKGSDLLKGAEIPLIETLKGFTIQSALKLAKQSYLCPSWIYSKYKKLFAYRLDEVKSDVVSIGKDDLGYFSYLLKPKPGNFVLIKDKGNYKIEKYSKGMKNKVHSVLLAIEKKYIE